jgi:DNA (cytosine-5)-methyltransferase 1
MVDKQGLNELALFAGAGGGILGGHLLGWRTVCAVEWEPYAACVLAARQNDGFLPPFPIWDDVQTFDGKPWRGIVDVISGGFPCQDISIAGNGDGLEGERSGMWREMARIIHEVRPRFVFVENSPMLTSRGLGRVLGDLASMGFDAKWGVLGANDIGANHKRDRIWIRGEQMGNSYDNGQITSEIISSPTQRSNSSPPRQEQTCESKGSSEQYGELAYTECVGWSQGASEHGTSNDQKSTNYIGDCGQTQSNKVGNTKSTGFTPCLEGQRQGESWRASIGSSQWWEIEPPVDRVADGMVDRVDRLKAIGNGQVPLCAATAWRILK